MSAPSDIVNAIKAGGLFLLLLAINNLADTLTGEKFRGKKLAELDKVCGILLSALENPGTIGITGTIPWPGDRENKVELMLSNDQTVTGLIGLAVKITAIAGPESFTVPMNENFGGWTLVDETKVDTTQDQPTPAAQRNAAPVVDIMLAALAIAIAVPVLIVAMLTVFPVWVPDKVVIIASTLIPIEIIGLLLFGKLKAYDFQVITIAFGMTAVSGIEWAVQRARPQDFASLLCFSVGLLVAWFLTRVPAHLKVSRWMWLLVIVFAIAQMVTRFLW
jgi:hypothetical protein